MPSSATLAEQGLKAFNASNYTEAINYYTQALEMHPDAPDYYLKRSIAYQRSSKYELALHDAELATMLFDKRGKREAIGSAQIRRGIAFFLLCRYGDAGFCFQAAESRFGESHKERNMLGMWKKKLELVLEKLDCDDMSREVTVVEIPNIEVPKVANLITELETEVESAASSYSVSSATSTATAATTTSIAPLKATPPAIPMGVVTTPASKIRHEWYQTPSYVVLTLFVKGVPKDKAVIQISNDSVSISFPLPSGSDYVFDVLPLFDSIVASESTSTISSTKVELKLIKSTPGKKWADLEGKPETETSTMATPTTSTVITTANPTENKPVYPSSSKSGPKDWDKLANELSAKPKKRKGKNDGENDDGDGDDDDEGQSNSDFEGGDPVNHFFKKFYKDADEDTRRAMVKSYVESNGTALSTNWSEVGKSTVETSPPDGMTAKRWDG